MQRVKIFLSLTGLFILLPLFAVIQVDKLKTEGMINPQGIDALAPRFSWITTATVEQGVMQTSYQILVASSVEKLNAGEADVWNSGKVKSAASIWIPFQGEVLKSNQACYWKVKVWTNRGESDWSQPASWSMGLLNETDWKAQWIGLDKAMPWDDESYNSRLSVRYVRKDFPLQKDIKRAMVHVSGLGIYELFMNGKGVGDQVLAPAPTDFGKSVLYNSYEVTSLLKKGQNAVGVALGTGRYYNMRQTYKPWKVPT
jgi:alpha-L-rhamnosidase